MERGKKKRQRNRRGRQGHSVRYSGRIKQRRRREGRRGGSQSGRSKRKTTKTGGGGTGYATFLLTTASNQLKAKHDKSCENDASCPFIFKQKHNLLNQKSPSIQPVLKILKFFLVFFFIFSIYQS